MNDKHKIFISSVQSEFSRERKALARYIREDALLGDFFEVFLFEEQPAENRSAQSVYLDEVAMCDVYLGLFGSKYGSRDKNGISPTEREYDRATELHKTRLAFVKTSACREKKEPHRCFPPRTTLCAAPAGILPTLCLLAGQSRCLSAEHQ